MHNGRNRFRLSYEACIQRERNKGLFTADQQIEENGTQATKWLIGVLQRSEEEEDDEDDEYEDENED